MKSLMQRAIDNFDEVEPILKLVDFEPARKTWEEWAFKEHVRLLRENKSLFNRVTPINELVKQKMQGQSLIFACGIQKILEKIEEGEVTFYVNLKITKKSGEILVETLKEGEW